MGDRIAIIPIGGSIALYELVPPEEKQADIQELRRALEQDPDAAWMRFMLGNNLRNEGLLTEARSEYEKVAASDDKQYSAIAQRYLREVDTVGWRWYDVGPVDTWRCIWQRGLNPLTLKQR